MASKLNVLHFVPLGFQIVDFIGPNEHVSIYKWSWLLKHAAYPASYPKPVIDIPKEELQKSVTSLV